MTTTDASVLREAVLTRLSAVIDPETGVDVVRMRLIEDLTVDEEGVVRYKFHPSSPFCPLAVPLVLSIWEAVADVQGVIRQQVEVTGYVKQAELNAVLRGLTGTDQARAEKDGGKPPADERSTGGL